MGFLFWKNKNKEESKKPFEPVRIISPEGILKCMKIVDTGSALIVELVITEQNPNLFDIYHKQLISYASCLHTSREAQYDITQKGVRLIFYDLDKAKRIYSFWKDRLNNS